MAYHTSVLCQLLKLVPRLEFEKQANRVDGKRRSDALSRWSQFLALTIGQLGGRRSLRDIEATVRSQRHHRYHLGSQSISRSALGRANEQLDYRFYGGLFHSLYQHCMSKQRNHGFRFFFPQLVPLDRLELAQATFHKALWGMREFGSASSENFALLQETYEPVIPFPPKYRDSDFWRERGLHPDTDDES